MPTVTDQMLADQQQDIHDTLARITEQAQRLRASRDALLAVLRDVVSEIRKYHGDFDARVFVHAERAIAAASEFTD